MPDDRNGRQQADRLAGRGGPAPRPGRALQPRRALRERAARGLRRRLGEPGRARAFKTDVRLETAKSIISTQRQPRHQLRAVDQPLSRLRARLHLLLCPADALLSRPFGRARFRDQALRQGQRRRAAGARAGQSALCAEVHRARRRHRPLPAHRARAPHHARDAGGAGPHRAIPSASSPSRRWSCATSTSSRAWQAAASSRWRSR